MKYLATILLFVVAMGLMGFQFMVPGSTGGALGGSGSFALSHRSNAACATATTCSVTLSGSSVSGDLILVSASTKTFPTDISSISNCGTYVSGRNVNGTGGVNNSIIGYIYPASSTAGPCVVTFTGSSGGANVDFYDYTVSGGTPALDMVNSYFSTSSAFAGPAITLSGTKDAVLVGGMATTITAVNGLWTDSHFDVSQTIAGSADQVNVSSVTQPTWTGTGGNTWMQAIAFGFGVTVPVNWGLTDFSGGTNGVAPTATTLGSSTFGLPGSGNYNDNWQWNTGNDTGGFITYATAAHHALLHAAPRFVNGGATYSDSGSLGISQATGHAVNYDILYFPGKSGTTNESIMTGTVATGCIDFFTTIPANSTVWSSDTLLLFGNTGEYVNMHVNGDGSTLAVSYETVETGSGQNRTVISPSTWYKFCEGYQYNGTLQAAVFSDSGAQVGTTFSTTQTTAQYPEGIEYGSANGNTPAGFVENFDKLSVCFSTSTSICPFPPTFP